MPLLVLLLVASACAGEEDRGDIIVRWEAGRGELAEAVRARRVIEEHARLLNGLFSLPVDIPVIHRSCGKKNAEYTPRRGEITMCYELLDHYAELYDDEVSDALYTQKVEAAWVFTFYHELGHAFIHRLKLPATANEEDAADEFAAILMIESRQSENTLLAVDFWNPDREHVPALHSAADEHPLDSQRYYRTLCLVYGSAPGVHVRLVADGELPVERAERCPSEYYAKRRAWNNLLGPWMKG